VLIVFLWEKKEKEIKFEPLKKLLQEPKHTNLKDHFFSKPS
jgi:hypothetical protein